MNRTLKKECESSTEYILPDYLGDVRKVLSISASAAPAGRFVNDGEMHLSGIVNYSVLYSDSENKLYETSFSSDYDASLPVADEGGADPHVDTRVTNFAVRLTGPRKLSAKAYVRNTVSVFQDLGVTCGGDAFSDDSAPEVDKTVIEEEELLFGAPIEREYAESAAEVAAEADSIEIITSSGFVRINESVAVDGGVNVKGEITITSIIKTDDGAPYAIKKTIPFDETVEIEGSTEGMASSAEVMLTSVRADSVETQDGVSITVNAIAEISASVAHNRNVEIIRDAYLKNKKTEGIYVPMSYNRFIIGGNTGDHFHGESARSEIGADDIQSILTSFADVKSSECTISDKAIEIKGDIAVCAIACQINERSEQQHIPLKFTHPFCVKVSLGCQLPDSAYVDYKINAVNPECFIDSDIISAECDLDITYHISEEREITRMSECNVKDSEISADVSSSVTVYYPEPGESLFDIAKRYHSSCSDISADNGLSVDAGASLSDPALLSGVKKLIIR